MGSGLETTDFSRPGTRLPATGLARHVLHADVSTLTVLNSAHHSLSEDARKRLEQLDIVILRNRGHLSSYMAGLAPELYRDTLTDFIVRNNPMK